MWLRLGIAAPCGHSNCFPAHVHDHLGVHRLGCRNAAGKRTRRHDDVVAVIADAALAADPRAFRVAREERLQDAEDSQCMPGDVALDLGSGRTLVDLTIASPFAAAGQVSNSIAGFPAAAAATAYDRKINKWRALLGDGELVQKHESVSFQPIALTALGAWDERSLLWLKRFSDVCAAASGNDKGFAFSDLMEKLSVALWRGNSRLLRALRQAQSGELV